MAEVFFFIAGIGAVCGAVGVVRVRNPLYAVPRVDRQPVPLAPLLLLIAAVGAVALARRRGGIGHDEEDRVAVMDFRLPPGIGTMAEAVGGRSTREPLELGSGGGETSRGRDPEGGW